MKNVEPISGRKLGELARLLEERGLGNDVVQKAMVENIDGLCFFLRGRMGLGGIPWDSIRLSRAPKGGHVHEINDDGIIVGAALSITHHASGRIFRMSSEINVHSSCFPREVLIPNQRALIEHIGYEDGKTFFRVSRAGKKNFGWDRIEFTAENVWLC